MSRDDPYNAAEHADVRAAAKEARVAEISDLDTIRSIMATAPGRAWMYRKLVRCHIYTNPYSASTHDTAFACGEMNIGQMLLAEVDAACPDTYLLMMREANERAIVSDVNRNRAATSRNDDGEPRLNNPVDYTADESAGSAGNGKAN